MDTTDVTDTTYSHYITVVEQQVMLPSGLSCILSTGCLQGLVCFASSGQRSPLWWWRLLLKAKVKYENTSWVQNLKYWMQLLLLWKQYLLVLCLYSDAFSVSLSLSFLLWPPPRSINPTSQVRRLRPPWVEVSLRFLKLIINIKSKY